MKRLALLFPLLFVGCVMYPERRIHRVPAREPVSATRVVAMRTAGIPDDQILAKIGENGINREQNADDIVMMKNAGVSEGVITAMINAPVLPPTSGYVTEEVYYRDYPGYYDSGTSFWLGAALGYWLRPGHYRCR